MDHVLDSQLESVAMNGYVPHLLDGELGEVLGSHPAVLVVGPRACGKTTTARASSRTETDNYALSGFCPNAPFR